MTNRELKKEIKYKFKPQKKRYYFGLAKIGTPYMLPFDYCGSIIKIKKIKPKYSRLKNFKLGKYFIFYGYPIKISVVNLGWKDKFNSPRFEWSPQLHIFLFGLQFAIFWNSPDGDNDKYYEMILHYLYYADRDIKKAKETWAWVDTTTKKSTWDDKYLINARKLKLEQINKKKVTK